MLVFHLIQNKNNKTTNKLRTENMKPILNLKY